MESPFPTEASRRHRPAPGANPPGAVAWRWAQVAWQAVRARTARGVYILHRWAARARQRRALADLDARLLRDIGVHHLAARREYHKWFWQK